MSASDVQAFLENTPYDKRTFLADHSLGGGEMLSAALVRVASEDGLNPIVLLATLQKEAGLISRTTPPSTHRIDFAFGCGRSDGQRCLEHDKQLACAAERFAEYAADIASEGRTIAGWSVGQPRQTLEGTNIVPANVSTAALYTYTPWVLENQGGNWLFWNVWRRYSAALDYDAGLRFPFNDGFIGGSCNEDSDCHYAGGRAVSVCGRRGWHLQHQLRRHVSRSRRRFRRKNVRWRRRRGPVRSTVRQRFEHERVWRAPTLRDSSSSR